MSQRFLNDRRGLWNIVFLVFFYTGLWFLFTLVLFAWSGILFSYLWHVLKVDLIGHYEEYFYLQIAIELLVAIVPTWLYGWYEYAKKERGFRTYLNTVFD